MPDNSPKDIFISYRRGPDNRLSFAIYEHLTKYGYTVFRDRDQLRYGSSFPAALRAAVDAATDVVVLMDGDAITSHCRPDQVDYFHAEINQAVAEGKNVIPISIGFIEPIEALRNAFKTFLEKHRIKWDDDHAQNCLELLAVITGSANFFTEISCNPADVATKSLF